MKKKQEYSKIKFGSPATPTLKGVLPPGIITIFVGSLPFRGRGCAMAILMTKFNLLTFSSLFFSEGPQELISFQDNNNQTLIKSKAFYKLNRELVYQALSNEPHRQSYFSSDQGGKTGVMPKHNEDFSNAEQKEKNKFMGIRI